MLEMMCERSSDIGVHLRLAEIEEAVGEAKFFRHLGFRGRVENGSGSVAPNTSGIRDANFNLAGGHGGIDSAFIAGDHFAIHPDDGLFGKRRNQIVDRRTGLDNKLGDAVVIGEIDKINAAVVAAIPEPAGEPDVGSGLGASQFAACVSPVAVHFASFVFYASGR